MTSNRTRIARRVFLGLGLLAAIIQVLTFVTGIYSLGDMWSSFQGRATLEPRAVQWILAHEFQVFLPPMIAFCIFCFISAQRIEPNPILDSPEFRLAVVIIWYISLVISLVGAALWLVTAAFLGFP
jgi:hypothetical protein